MLVRMNGNIPNSFVGAFHVSPKRKFQSPISRIAGTPEITRYRQMHSTNPTAAMPQRRKIHFTIFSKTFFINEFQKLLRQNLIGINIIIH